MQQHRYEPHYTRCEYLCEIVHRTHDTSVSRSDVQPTEARPMVQFASRRMKWIKCGAVWCENVWESVGKCGHS